MWERNVNAVNKSDVKRTNRWHTRCWVKSSTVKFWHYVAMQKVLYSYVSAPYTTVILWLLSCPRLAEERTLSSPSLENVMVFIYNSTQLFCCTRAKQTANTIRRKFFFLILYKGKHCAIGFLHQVTENFEEESVNLRNRNSYTRTKNYIGTPIKQLRSIFAIRIKSAM